MSARVRSSYRRIRAAVLTGLLALTLAGCASPHKKALSAYETRLTTPTTDYFPTATELPKSLVTCMDAHATSLGAGMLTALGTGLGGKHVSSATKTEAATLLTGCLTAARTKQLDALLAKRVTLPQSSVPGLDDCYRRVYAMLGQPQLAKLITAGVLGGTAQTAETTALGQTTLTTCAHTGPIETAVRKQFVAGVRSGASGSQLPTAFKTCLLKAAAAITPAQVQQLIEGTHAGQVSKAIAHICRPETSA